MRTVAFLTILCVLVIPASVVAEGNFDVVKRSRPRGKGAASGAAVREVREKWDARKSAVVVCDMWNEHWCKGATRRGAEVAPRIDAFVREARRLGSTIVHAPSGCMKTYTGHPSRKRAQETPKAKSLPPLIARWCHSIPEESGGVYPVDQSDGGCDCDPRCQGGGPWTKQTELIGIDEGPSDVISDSGEEIWSVFAQRGIDNVFVVGVHTNMCVLGRPFGLRNLSRYGKNVVLVRDLTDTMYNPEAWPRVDHFRGTDLIVEHIEKFVCPTITSADVLGGEAFRFPRDVRPRVVIAVAEREYQTWETLPRFVVDSLESRLGLDVTIVRGKANGGPGRNFIPGLREALEDADLLFLSVRRRALPAADLAAVRAHVAAGGPVVGIRTSSHSFDTRGKHPDGHAEWRDFDPAVLGGNYRGHYGNGPTTTVTMVPGARAHPILAGVQGEFESVGSLYQVSPLEKGTTPLLTGAIPGKPAEPVAWTNLHGRSRVFYTSLGHAKDFETAAFRRLLENGILWALDRRIPAPPAKG